MAVVFEITGFYFRKTLQPGMAQGKSVRAITEMLQDTKGDDGGTLLASQFDSKGFLQRLTVSFRDQDPKSGQIRRPEDFAGPAPHEPQVFPRGVYSYRDLPKNSFAGDGLISFSPSWQYYIFGRDNKLKNAAQRGPNDELLPRTIIPAGSSNTGDNSVEIVDGDRITWRLVAIGGVADALREKEKKLSVANAERLQQLIDADKLTARGALKMANELLASQ